MKTSDFQRGELFSFTAKTALWDKEITLNIELDEERDLSETLACFIDVINERLLWLGENRAAVVSSLCSDGVHDRLGVSEQELSAQLSPDEATVYCDDGRENVWVHIFLNIGSACVEVSLSPENLCESRGVCG